MIVVYDTIMNTLAVGVEGPQGPSGPPGESTDTELREILSSPEGGEYVKIGDSSVAEQLDEKVPKNENSTVTAQIDMNGGGWGKIYDTDLWIAGRNRINPTNNSQGLYVQHRVTGDLGGLVHDAAAAELRLVGATNTGTGQSAFEASLVVPGGVNDMNSLNAILGNFHTTGTPTGNINEVAIVRASQIPTLAVGLTIDVVYGMIVDPQIVGSVANYGIHSIGQNVFGPIVAKDNESVSILARGRTGQTGALFAAQNALGSTLFSVGANGIVGIGGQISGNSFYVNNNNAAGNVVAFRVRGGAAQTVDIFQVQDGAQVPRGGFNRSGALYTALNAEPADAHITAGQCLFWFDSTDGAPALKIKAKQANGTVKTATIPLT